MLYLCVSNWFSKSKLTRSVLINVDTDHHIHCVADLSIAVIFHQVVMCHHNISVNNKICNISIHFMFCLFFCKILLCKSICCRFQFPIFSQNYSMVM